MPKVIFSLISFFFFFYNHITMFFFAGSADSNPVVFRSGPVRRFFLRPTQPESSFFAESSFSEKMGDVPVGEISLGISKLLIITFITIYANKEQF